MPDADDLARVIVLLFGKTEEGGPFWCYVAVKPSQYEAFQIAEKEGTINLYDFDHLGEIIVSAEGERPPQHITEEVGRMYGTDARNFFKDIDPLAEIEKKMSALEEEARAPDDPKGWAARFKRR